MRIGILPLGSRGDVQPYIALGTGFKGAGYEVRVLTHGTFADAVRAEGLEFADFGVDVRSVSEQAMREASLAGQSRFMALTTLPGSRPTRASTRCSSQSPPGWRSNEPLFPSLRDWRGC
jgi:sterol 3beta-glucosyltransferase